ncbi:MAG: hypothetical protein BWX50_00053 [Euryarchaeota archaeon ADurb.Bin009]|jgi:hypothetical protein|nr:MAG: hypothetical protein BWX50_00053 [Euryarchaeota archaeon ADurb.Bin009]HOR78808.1 hypothetical protein [Anaerolineaceae bacterium]
MSDNEADTYSYKGWLVSDSFVKRAFAVFGYNLVAGLLIWFGLLVIFMIFAMIAAFAFGVTSIM